MAPMTTTEDRVHAASPRADQVAEWAGPSRTPTDGPLTLEELQLAGRNRGMPLEAMRYDITPTGLHYLLVHFDIPAVDAATWRLSLGGLVDRPIQLSLDERCQLAWCSTARRRAQLSDVCGKAIDLRITGR